MKYWVCSESGTIMVATNYIKIMIITTNSTLDFAFYYLTTFIYKLTNNKCSFY